MSSRLAPVALAAAASLITAAAAVAQSPEPIQPIVPPQQVNLGQVELGKKLYFDPRLSKSGFISCNSCHNLMAAGDDNRPNSIGMHDARGGPQTPQLVLPEALESMTLIPPRLTGAAQDALSPQRRVFEWSAVRLQELSAGTAGSMPASGLR